jgi:hypothetical protein
MANWFDSISRGARQQTTSPQTDRLVQQHRQVAEMRGDRASRQRQQQRSGRTNYTARVVQYDRQLGVVELQLPDGGRFRARSISSQALIPGQTIPIAILPKGQSIGVVDAPPARC